MGPNLFFSQSSPAHSPKLIFHIINKDSSVSLSVVHSMCMYLFFLFSVAESNSIHQTKPQIDAKLLEIFKSQSKIYNSIVRLGKTRSASDILRSLRSFKFQELWYEKSYYLNLLLFILFACKFLWVSSILRGFAWKILNWISFLFRFL